MPSIELSNLSDQQIKELVDDITEKTERDKEEEKINRFSDAEKRQILLETAEQKEKEQAEAEAEAKKSFFVKFVNGLSKLLFNHVFFWAYIFMCYNLSAPSLNSDLVKYKVKRFYENSNDYYQIKNRQAIYNLCMSQAKTAFDAAKPGSYQAYLAESKRLDCGNIVNSDIGIGLYRLDKWSDFYKLDKTTIENAKAASNGIMYDMGISPSTNSKIGQVLFVLDQQLKEKAKQLNITGAI